MKKELSKSLETPIIHSHKGRRKNPSLIYIDIENNLSKIKSMIKVIILIIICDQLMNTFFIFNLKGLNYRMCELCFVCLITLIIFKIPIYKHKKVAIAFILLLCCIMKNYQHFIDL